MKPHFGKLGGGWGLGAGSWLGVWDCLEGWVGVGGGAGAGMGLLGVAGPAGAVGGVAGAAGAGLGGEPPGARPGI